MGSGATYPYISAIDVLNENLSSEHEEALFNSLVFIGSTATGLFDLRSTPMENIYPGVEVHANILNAILNSAPTITVASANQALEAETGMDAMLSSLTASHWRHSHPNRTGSRVPSLRSCWFPDCS